VAIVPDDVVQFADQRVGLPVCQFKVHRRIQGRKPETARKHLQRRSDWPGGTSQPPSGGHAGGREGDLRGIGDLAVPCSLFLMVPNA
jgi:hypothetical protein